MANSTREVILEKALDMFSERGYERTNLRELSEQVGITKSALYKHFDSKEDIWNSTMEYYDNYYYKRAVNRNESMPSPKTIEEFNTEALIASSTSGLVVTDIAATTKYPERIVAGHPFNPVHLMPLVEVCPGEKSDPDAVQCAYDFYQSIHKQPVILTKAVPGFIVNRIQLAMNREVQDLVNNGICSVEDVDKAVIFGMGLRLGLIGPHLVFELAGGNGGIEEFLGKYGSGNLANLAAWTERPKEYDAKAVAGTKEELSHRTQREGKDHDSLATFRDLGLIYLLKYHGLL